MTSIFPPPQLQSEDNVQNLAAELRAVKNNIKRLTRAAAARHQEWLPTARLKTLAALVYELCQETRWAIVFVKMHQRAHMTRTMRLPRDVSSKMIITWWANLQTTPRFRKALRNVDDPYREVVDKLLMQSLMYEFVVNQSAKGLVVPSSTVIAKYMAAWSLRPTSPRIARNIEDMQESKIKRRRWCAAFRAKWNIAYGVCPHGPPLGLQEMKDKVHMLTNYPPGTPVEMAAMSFDSQLRSNMQRPDNMWLP